MLPITAKSSLIWSRNWLADRLRLRQRVQIVLEGLEFGWLQFAFESNDRNSCVGLALEDTPLEYSSALVHDDLGEVGRR